MSDHSKDLPPIKFKELADALLARASTVVAMWLPGGVLQGHEYVCGSLSGGSGTSCSVNIVTGRWADFASDDKGNDLVSLYAAVHGMTMGKAALHVAREEGLEDVAGVQPARPGEAAPPKPVRPVEPPKPAKVDEGWATVVPVPGNAPAPNFNHFHRSASDITHTAAYMRDGELLGYVVRFQTSDGGKDTLPHTWCTSARTATSKWHWRQWDAPRPLFYPGGNTPGTTQTVILVEGEKKAEALQALLEANAPGVYVVVSWAGGCKAWDKAAWSWIAGCHVLLWPDCDAKRVPLTKTQRDSIIKQVLTQLEQIGGEITDNDHESAKATGLELASRNQPLLPESKQPGMKAMLDIGAVLVAQGCTVQLLPIPKPLAVPDGWDCGDAINTDGWGFGAVLEFFGKAQPLPAAEDPNAKPEQAPAKKIDGLAGAGDGDLADAVAKDMPWWLAPYWDVKKCFWRTSRKLVIKALEEDEALAGVLGLNELSNNIDARRAWPWVNGKAGPLTGATDLLLGDYLTRTYGLPSMPRANLIEAIETVAHMNRFHPVQEYLRGLKHDGVPRIDKWLLHVMGETPESIAEQYKEKAPRILEYLSLVGRFILLGMVNRVMDPGCKFDYCPVLEGPGGLGKSTFAEVLATGPYFSDTHFDVARGKDGQEQVQGLWIYEIAELANFGKAEIALIKAFISAKVDRYRPSYGRTVESYPRQCVLIGTTNEKTYLRDRTGNRRFWPIPVRWRINIPWLKARRDQLLAEAYALFLQGVPFTPTPEQEERLFVPMQESRLVETAVLSELLNVLTREAQASGIQSIVNGLTDFVTIAQLTMALGVDAAKSSPALEAQIRGWLEHEGWERVKKQRNGARAWGYERPKYWPPEDNDADDAPPAAADPTNPTQDDDHAPF